MIEHIKELAKMYEVTKEEKVDSIKAAFLAIETNKYYLSNGEVITRDVLIKPVDRAAIIIPRTEDGKYVMVMQTRVATKNKVAVEFPAGLIENDEDIVKGMKRELKEETGYETDKVDLLMEYYSDTGATKTTVTLGFADNCKKVSNQKLDEDEFVSFFEVTVEEMEELIKEGLIVDGNTMFSIELIKNRYQ